MTPDPSLLQIFETGGIAIFAGALLWLTAKGASRMLDQADQRIELATKMMQEQAAQTELLRMIGDKILGERTPS